MTGEKKEKKKETGRRYASAFKRGEKGLLFEK
jgi:hypothetical protein